MVSSSHNINRLRIFLFIDCRSAKSTIPSLTNKYKPPQVTLLMKQKKLEPCSHMSHMSLVSVDGSINSSWLESDVFLNPKNLDGEETKTENGYLKSVKSVVRFLNGEH